MSYKILTNSRSKNLVTKPLGVMSGWAAFPWQQESGETKGQQGFIITSAEEVREAGAIRRHHLDSGKL